MKQSVFNISKMDCPSEEHLIRMKLDGIEGIIKLDFDIPNRKLSVIHSGNELTIGKQLSELNLGAKAISTKEIDNFDITENNNQSRIL